MKIYNTLTRKKEEFKPIKRNKVGMYVCGPTVYDEPHIGHVRSAYIFEVIRQYLGYKGMKVKFVKNVTDVDDKIITKAKELKREDLNQATKDIAEKYLARYHEDMDRMGFDRPDVEPKATEHIKDMIRVIQLLIEKGYAYEAGGDVYYNIRKFKDYGKLSNQSLDKMEIGARISPGENKKDPLDFALWKKSKENEPSWDSPWGDGRPGWHIECSVMSTLFLGENFDIHGGGLDLIFPHHENEIAQAQGFKNTRFANCWIHNGLLAINGEKMSKSLGNFISVKDALEKNNPEIIKLLFLMSHYRSPIDFNDDKINEVKSSYERFSILFDKLERMGIRKIKPKTVPEAVKEASNKFIKAMDDDFNTPKAMVEMFELVNLANKIIDEENLDKEKKQALGYIRYYLEEWEDIFGLFATEEKVDSELVEFVEKKIKQRKKAREEKNFEGADRIRQELSEKGIVLEDSKGGTHWRKK